MDSNGFVVHCTPLRFSVRAVELLLSLQMEKYILQPNNVRLCTVRVHFPSSSAYISQFVYSMFKFSVEAPVITIIVYD